MVGKSEKQTQIIAHIVMIFLCLCAVLPFILLLAASLTDESAAINDGFNFIPKVFSLDAYAYLMHQAPMILRAYGITLLVTVVGTMVSLIVTSMLGYGITKNIPGKRALNFYVIFTMLFNGGLVPTYLIYTKYFHIANTLWALIIPGLLLNAFNVMLVRNYFSSSIPDALIESAMLDGAGEFAVFRQIVIPLSKPIMATIGLMTALGYWNDWTNGLYYLDDTSLYSIQNVLNAINKNITVLSSMASSNISVNKADLPMVTARMAIAVIGIVPILCAYPFFQRYFVKGITLGAVKG